MDRLNQQFNLYLCQNHLMNCVSVTCEWQLLSSDYSVEQMAMKYVQGPQLNCVKTDPSSVPKQVDHGVWCLKLMKASLLGKESLMLQNETITIKKQRHVEGLFILHKFLTWLFSLFGRIGTLPQRSHACIHAPVYSWLCCQL